MLASDGFHHCCVPTVLNFGDATMVGVQYIVSFLDYSALYNMLKVLNALGL